MRSSPRQLSPAVLSAIGLTLTAIAAAIRTLKLPTTADACVALTIVLGVAVGVAGLVSALFQYAAHRRFEWLVAWRYLRCRPPGPRRVLLVGVVLALLGALLGQYGPQLASGPKWLPKAIESGVQTAGLTVLGVGAVVILLGILLLAFTAYAAISILGVLLGTALLVVVLSIMGGFATDLRDKILGTRAHIVVSKREGVFREYRTVLKKIDRIVGVRAVSPFVEGEVMITNPGNHAGILLRGIDPRRITATAKLEQQLRTKDGAGNLRYLSEPERLARIPAAPTDEAWRNDETEVEEKPIGLPRAAEGGQTTSPAEPTLRKIPLPPKVIDPTTAASEIDGTDYHGHGERVLPRPVYPGIIVGVELAKSLRLYVGDDVNVISPLGGMSPMGPIPKSRPLRVAGIFYSGMYEYDTKYAYVLIPTAQQILGLEDEISGFEILAAEELQITTLAARLRSILGKRCEVQDWEQLNRSLFSALRLEKVVIFVVLAIEIMVAALAILITLTMTVLERSREIAVLKAMGANRFSALKIFGVAGIYVGIIGMLGGIFVGVMFCTALTHFGWSLKADVYYISQLPVRVDGLEVALVALCAVSLSAAVTIHPALISARLRPVEGLRREV